MQSKKVYRIGTYFMVSLKKGIGIHSKNVYFGFFSLIIIHIGLHVIAGETIADHKIVCFQLRILFYDRCNFMIFI